MAKVFSFTHFSNGQRIFLANPHIEPKTDHADSEGYQYFDVYDDEYLENKLGLLGIKMTSTVWAMWSFGAQEEKDPRDTLSNVMRLALPFLKLPISSDQYEAIPSSYFPLVELFSEGEIFYDKKSRIIHMPSGKNPEDFFKSIIFKGEWNEKNVRLIVIMHGYLEGLNDNFNDFRFLSIEITKALDIFNSQRITNAYNGLLEDGTLELVGRGRTSSGFPSFSRIPSETRKLIENLNMETEPQPIANSHHDPDTPPYISDRTIDSLVQSAKNKGYDTTKLESLIEELNDAVSRNKAQSSHALIRTLLDHIAPLFGFHSFSQVANNYNWTKTDKKRVKELDTLFRFDVDESLHSPISNRNTATDTHSIGLIRRTINVILEEATAQASDSQSKT